MQSLFFKKKQFHNNRSLSYVKKKEQAKNQ